MATVKQSEEEREPKEEDGEGLPSALRAFEGTEEQVVLDCQTSSERILTRVK